MYYPLLRARQFELIALRDLANDGVSQGFIVPILEPVKKSYNNLTLALRAFQERDQSAYLIVNPLCGDIEGDHTIVLDYLIEYQWNVNVAFHYKNNATFISNCIRDYNLQNCMLISPNDISNGDIDFTTLVNSASITAITVEDPGRNRSLHRFLRNLNKTYIRLDDLFEKQSRNSDFLGIPEHRFSEEHLYYREEGFNGFADYTVLPSHFSDGGSTPRAVVIHLTYLNGQNQIWIRHFTSDTNDSIANIQGKFAEAASKAVRFCQNQGLQNAAINELQDYFDRQHYPGLGTVKKISIKNHLLILQDYLNNN
jgi:hypothetical protein